MKIEASKAELAEAYIYGAVGFVQGVYRHFVVPVIEDEPVALFAVAGVVGGLLVSKLIFRET